MAAAGLIVEGLFAVAGLDPDRPTRDDRRDALPVELHDVPQHRFLGLFAVLYWLYRNRDRFGGGQGYAIDPVCGMQVQTANAPAHATYDGSEFWFCSDHCRERFDTDPGPYAAKHGQPEPTSDGATDPVCGMSFDPDTAVADRTHDGREFWFCGNGCAAAFEADPAQYIGPTLADAHHHHDH